MATVNIRRDVKDSFYRYKMPKLISKVSSHNQHYALGPFCFFYIAASFYWATHNHLLFD